MPFLRKTASISALRPLIHAFLLQADIMVGDGKPAMPLDNVCPEFDISLKLSHVMSEEGAVKLLGHTHLPYPFIFSLKNMDLRDRGIAIVIKICDENLFFAFVEICIGVHLARSPLPVFRILLISPHCIWPLVCEV